MAQLKVKLVEAKGLKARLAGLDKADSFVSFKAGGKWFNTEVQKETLNPKWNQEFDCQVEDPSTEVLFFTVKDKKSPPMAVSAGIHAGLALVLAILMALSPPFWLVLAISIAISGGIFFGMQSFADKLFDDEIGGSAMALTTIIEGETQTYTLPIYRSGGESGTLTVEVTSANFTGLSGVVQSLKDTEQRLKKDVADLGLEVDELGKTKDALKGEVDRFAGENAEHKRLNDELEKTSQEFKTQVGELTTQVDRFEEQNKKLEGEVDTLSQENVKLDGIRQDLDSKVAELGTQVDRFSAENDRLKGEVDRFTAENDRLEQTANALKAEVESLKGEVTKFSAENDRLEETRKGLDDQVQNLGGEVEAIRAENEKLAATREELETQVAALGNKIKVLDGELKNLQKTREMLDEQVSRAEEQNSELTAEVDQLASVQKGMAELAEQQGEDYAAFVSKLNASLKRHEELLEKFAGENAKLKENRKKGQVESYLAMVNSFATWDMKAGLSAEEFTCYMEMLGPDFEQKVKDKYGDMASAHAALDTDGNGSLNIQEVRKMLDEIIAAEE